MKRFKSTVFAAAAAALALSAGGACAQAWPTKPIRWIVPYTPGGITDNVTRMVNFGSSGVGAAAHLTTELLKQTAGIDMTHVPYKGTAAALTDLISGNIQILGDTPSSMMPHVRAGKIKALGMFSARWLAAAPEVPTSPESGGPAIEASTWVMFLAPAGTPGEVVDKLALSDPTHVPR